MCLLPLKHICYNPVDIFSVSHLCIALSGYDYGFVFRRYMIIYVVSVWQICQVCATKHLEVTGHL